MKKLKRIVPLLSFVMFAGCSLVPSEHQKQTAITASGQVAVARDMEITKQNVLPPVTVTTSGTNNTVNLNVPAASTVLSAKSDDAVTAQDSAKGESRVSIPAGVKLLLLAAGLAALAVVVGVLRHSSAAVNAAYGAADAGFARAIGIVEDRLKHAQDSQTIAHLSSVQTVMEKERGKLNAQ